MFEWFATQNTAMEDLEVMVYLQLSLWIVVTHKIRENKKTLMLLFIDAGCQGRTSRSS